MNWNDEREALRGWLHPRCPTRAEFQFYDDLFDDLTDMFEGDMQDDPMLWHHYVTSDNSLDQEMGFDQHRKFVQEAWERGYDLREIWDDR